MSLELCTLADAEAYFKACKLKRRPYGRLPSPKTVIYQNAEGYEVHYKDVPIAKFRKNELVLVAPQSVDVQMASVAWRWRTLLLPKKVKAGIWRRGIVEVWERDPTSKKDKVFYISRNQISLSFMFLDKGKDFLNRRERSFLGFKAVLGKDGEVLEPLDRDQLRDIQHELFAVQKAEARKANGVYRQVDQVYEFEGWVVYRLRERTTWNLQKRAYVPKGQGMHFVHRCEANLTEKLAARGKRRKRCPACKEWVPDSMKMLIDLQKVGR